jgi:hypothetical protein
MLAHALTLWIVDHSHGAAVRAGHHHTATAAVAAGCLIAAALLAAVLVGSARRLSTAGRARRRADVVQWSAGLSTAAFAVAELVEHTLLRPPDSPPPVVLLLGAVLHAVVAAASSLFWLRYRDSLDQVLALHGGVDVAVERPRLAGAAASVVPHAARLLPYAIVGRAPPLVTVA